MSTNYPTTLDTAKTITSTSLEDDTGILHDVVHQDLEDRAIAIETYVGVSGSAVTTTISYKVAAALAAIAALGTASALASDTDTALSANSDLRVATQKAVKAYIDAIVVGLLDFKSTVNCSGNPNYPAALKGDAYVVSVAGKIGGASGTSVDVGDWYICEADNAGGTEASVGASWGHIEHSLVGALLSANNLSDLASAATARSNLGLGGAAVLSVGTTAGTVAAGDDSRFSGGGGGGGSGPGSIFFA